MPRYFILFCFLFCFLSACGPSPQIESVEKLLSHKNYEKAQRELNIILTDDSQHLDARALLGHTLFFLDDIDGALSALKQVYKVNPRNPYLQQFLTVMVGEFNKLDQLVKQKNVTSKTILSYIQEVELAYFKRYGKLFLAYHYLDNANGESLKPLLQELVLSTDSVIQQLALSLQAKVSPDEQRHQLYRSLISQYSASELKILWYWETYFLLKNENKSAANELLIEFKGAIKDKALQSAIIYKQVDLLLEENPSAAFNYLLKYLKTKPGYSKGRAAIYKVIKNFSKQLSSEHHRFLAHLAYEYWMYNTSYYQFLKIGSPTNEELYLTGISALKSKWHAKAIQVFNQLISKAPHSQEAGKAKIALAKIQRLGKKYSIALRQLDDVFDNYSAPSVIASAFREQAIIYDHQNQESKRVGSYRQIVEKFPEHEYIDEALWRVIWSYYQQKSYSQAIQLLEKNRFRIKKSKERSKFRYWQARLYELTGKSAAAKKIYKKLAQGLGFDYYTHRAQARLNKLDKGVKDLFSTSRFTGLKKQASFWPELESIFFKHFQPSDKKKKLSDELLALVYFNRIPEFFVISEFTNRIEWHKIRGKLLHRQGRFYEAIQNYRYKIEEADDYLSLAYPLVYFKHIEKEAKKYKMNPFLVAALIWQESQYQPTAKSWVGATGLMQIMPGTAQHIASEMPDVDKYDLTKPQTSIKMGTWYLNYTHESFEGNSLYAVASYNAGRGPVYRWKKNYNHYPFDAIAESITYPETREYVKKVFTGFWIYQKLYGK